ncbi:hypothetical protein Hypma_006350 [Hypsizygus marmoreus]|uniref:Uncharacterized protein n=1 Tax=Hypsizygus marmoreus TaxID=39966 RepID=A0A369JVI9_HYPMA|nr:hypothetical protein Hypma_006350 [Hypsizygus marmoreus]
MISSTILLLALALNAASSSLAAPTPIVRGVDVVARAVTDSGAPVARDIADLANPKHRFIRRRLPVDAGMTDSKAVRDVDPKAAIAGRQPSTKETIIISSSSLTTIQKIHDDKDGKPGKLDGHPHTDVTSTTSTTTVHIHGKHRHGKHCPLRGGKKSPHGSCTCKHLCSDGQDTKKPGKKCPGPGSKGPTDQVPKPSPTTTTSDGPTPTSETPTGTATAPDGGPGLTDKTKENGDSDEKPASPEPSNTTTSTTSEPVPGATDKPAGDAKEEPAPKVVPSLVPTADKLKVLPSSDSQLRTTDGTPVAADIDR